MQHFAENELRDEDGPQHGGDGHDEPRTGKDHQRKAEQQPVQRQEQPWLYNSQFAAKGLGDFADG